MSSRIRPVQRLVLPLFGISMVLSAQLSESPKPPVLREFEVAAIKPYVPPAPQPGRKSPGASGMRGGPGTNSPGEVIWNGALEGLILAAYNLRPYEVVGPESLNTERFTIIAKVRGGTTREEMLTMWQSLLQQRFGLEYHRAPREVSVYDIVVAKSGVRLKESPPAAPARTDGPPRWTTGPNECPVLADGRNGPSMRMVAGRYQICAAGMTMESLVAILSSYVERPLVDKTGLAGKYDFKLEFQIQGAQSSVAGAANADGATAGLLGDNQDVGPSLMFALPEQLGLRLEPSKASIQALVIDKIKPAPAEN